MLCSRYYLRFKDQYRQLALEVLQGVRIKDEAAVVSGLRLSSSASNLADKARSADNSLNASFYTGEEQQQQDCEAEEAE